MQKAKHIRWLQKILIKGQNKKMQLIVLDKPLFNSAEAEGTLMHGKQSILKSSALLKSRTINATKALS